MIRFLEANGYDLSYFTAVDAARSGSLIQNHRVYISSGHDEYASGPRRASVQAARDAGVNLAFFSGNEFFWKTRWENSTDGSNTPYRTLVCYKETLANTSSGGIFDPLDPPTWTGTWRDPRYSPPADGGHPENALTGTIFEVNGPGSDNTDLSILVPAADGKMRFWRNTAIASQPAGKTATLPAGTLGYEWDVDADNGARPAGLFHMSTSTYKLTVDYLEDYGATYGPGTATHSLTMYRAPSGALVFGAGTVQWAWGLDANHDGNGGNPDVSMQQATINLFADMGVQPGSLQPGLVAATASTDTTPPTSVITSPAPGTVLEQGVPVTITGTATDSGGGVVGGVEVSTDGGKTWHPANGRETWSYVWAPSSSGSMNILSRAVDDSANLEVPGSGVTITVPHPPIYIDAQAFGDSPSNVATVSTASFSTASSNELLLAFVSTDYLGGANTTVTKMTGAGLTWVLVLRTNVQSGTSEIWRAFAPSPLSNASVTATLSQAVDSSITVMSFSGVNTSGSNGSGAIGAVKGANAYPGAPSASLVTTQSLSWVFGVGNDYDNAVARTPGTAQSLVHQMLTPSGDTYWVQMQNGPTPLAGTTVTINDTAPSGDRFNLSIVEILPGAGTQGSGYAIAGSVTPAASGSGTTLTLSGASSASATADSSGNYSFSSLANGNYTVTPSKPGYTFNPPSQSVTINSGNASGVDFAAIAPPATLALSSTEAFFNADQGGSNPAPMSLTVSNTGGGSLSFTASSDSSWLTATPPAGTAPQSLQLSVNTSGLTLGSYTGHITVTASGAQNSPATVTIALNIGMATDWLTGFHDVSRSSFAADESILGASNVGSLALSWTTSVDGNVVAQPLFVHSISIAGQTRDVLVVGTGGNSIYTMDAGSGAVLWKKNFGSPEPSTYGLPDGFGIEGSPVIDRLQGRIYTVSVDGNFHVLSLFDGSEVYAALNLVANPNTNSVWGALSKIGNSVYFATGSNGGDVKPWRGQAYQVDVSAAPKLAGNFVVVPSIPAPNGGGGIWGYGGISSDPATGNMFAASAYDSNQTTLPHSDSMLALDANLNLLGSWAPVQSGSIPCNNAPCDLDFASTPTVLQPSGCPAMLATGNKNGNLYLFRAADLVASGSPRQTIQLNAPNDSLGSGGVGGVTAWWPTNNMLFVSDAGPGYSGVSAGLVALNVAANCSVSVAWSVPLSGNDTPNSMATVANGVVFIGEGDTGIIHAYNALTGAQLWKSGSAYPAGATFAAPVVAGGKLYTASWKSLSSGGGIVGAFALPVTGPILSVSPGTLSFNVTSGGSNPAPATLSVTNSGTGSLSFTAASDSPWLTVTPPSGSAPQILQASVSIAGLSPATYTGHITVTAAGAQNSPFTATVTLTVSSSSGGGATLAIDTSVETDSSSAGSSISTPTFSTSAGNELLLAFVTSDALSSNMTVSAISGAGLTWTLVNRTNARGGTSEIWRAFAPAALSNATVKASFSQSAPSASITLVSFTGVDTTGTGGVGAIGAVGSANAASGAPSATLTTTRNSSWVIGVGNDYDNALSRTLGASQVLVHQYLSSSGDTFWVQRQNATTPLSGTKVTINDTAPTKDSYNLSIVEILPSLSSSPGYSISGSVTPSASGAGTTLSLSGASSGSATADSSGNFTFTNLAAGNYTVTPAKSGFTFTPVSQPVTIASANVTGINFTATPSSGGGTLAIDANVSQDETAASSTVSTASISTTAANELLLAFVATDYLKGSNTQVKSVSGGGLTWALVRRTNTQSGSAEIWRAFASSPVSNATVTATLSQSVIASITVMSFTGVDTSGTDGSGAIGATGSANAASGAPSASLVTTRNNSWVIGVGNDFDNAIARTVGTGQSLVHQHLTSAGDTYWVQMQNTPTPVSGTTVLIDDTAPTGDRYNLSICEILPHP